MTTDDLSEQSKPHVVAVVGLAGAGKSTVSNLLGRRYGYKRIYFGGHVVQEVARRGLPPGPESERRVREDLRTQHGMAAMAVLSSNEIDRGLANGTPMVIDGLYSLSELEYLRSKYPVFVVAVHSSTQLRQSRLATRSDRPLSPSELHDRDRSEMLQLEKAQPIAMADYHVVNVGSIDDLEQQLDKMLEHLREQLFETPQE